MPAKSRPSSVKVRVASCKYHIGERIGEGTFATVSTCRREKDGRWFAIKCLRTPVKSRQQISSLREIQALLLVGQSPYILCLEDIVYENGTVGMIFELMTMNLFEFISARKRPPSESRVGKIMYAVCRGIEYMHTHNIFHRDLKPENILIRDDVVKIADLGSSQAINTKRPYTEYVATRWYRSPETIMGVYSAKMDCWSIGCVFFELLTLNPLFPGNNELDTMNRIHEVTGTPCQQVLESITSKAKTGAYLFGSVTGTGVANLLDGATSSNCCMILELLLTYDPQARISARKAVKHTFFKPWRNHEKKSMFSETGILISKPSSEKLLPSVVKPRRHQIAPVSGTGTRVSKLNKRLPAISDRGR